MGGGLILELSLICRVLIQRSNGSWLDKQSDCSSAPTQILLLTSAKPAVSPARVLLRWGQEGVGWGCLSVSAVTTSVRFVARWIRKKRRGEKCYGSPPGAELGTLTSVRMWSTENAPPLPGDLLWTLLSFIYYYH